MSFIKALQKQFIISDGAIGTQLQAAGLAAGEEPTLWNITHPEAVLQVHKNYLEAGALIATTNTFGAHGRNLESTPYSVQEVVAYGVRIARKAVEQNGGTGFVALGLGPLGELLAPMGNLSFDEAVALFKEQLSAGVDEGADLILIETMIDTYELKAAVVAAREVCDLPIVATVAINAQGRLLNGANLTCVCALLEGLGVSALGINCGAGPEDVAPYFEELKEVASIPLVCSPNAGLPELEDGRYVYHTSPEDFAQHMLQLTKDGVAMAGGCCGTTPAHIKALAEACKALDPCECITSKRRIISSYASILDISNEKPRIDRRIDPAANTALVSGFKQGNFDDAIDEALDAQQEGAQVIGVCAIAEEVDEEKTLPVLVETTQAMVKVPLLIVSADLAALKRALRIYNGCALVDLSHFVGEEYQKAKEVAQSFGALSI